VNQSKSFSNIDLALKSKQK